MSTRDFSKTKNLTDPKLLNPFSAYVIFFIHKVVFCKWVLKQAYGTLQCEHSYYKSELITSGLSNDLESKHTLPAVHLLSLSLRTRSRSPDTHRSSVLHWEFSRTAWIDVLTFSINIAVFDAVTFSHAVMTRREDYKHLENLNSFRNYLLARNRRQYGFL